MHALFYPNFFTKLYADGVLEKTDSSSSVKRQRQESLIQENNKHKGSNTSLGKSRSLQENDTSS